MKVKLLFILVLLQACDKKIAPINSIAFTGAQSVKVVGYLNDMMEPFLSRDGSTLFFNNSNDPSVDTNLHYALRVNDSTFNYQGELQGVNTSNLEAVASMDKNGNFYFVSTRSYSQTFSSIYSSTYTNGFVSNINLVSGISKNQSGWVNFDVEVDAAGETLYFVDGRFDQSGGPYEADLIIAVKSNNAFQRSLNSSEILKNINTDALEYAAGISANNLELYFTRTAVPLTSSSVPEIFVASRSSPNEAFGVATKIGSITGFAEAPTLSPDGSLLYYHKKMNGKFGLYVTKRIN